MEFDAYVRSLGLDPTDLTPDRQGKLEAAWRASLNPPAPTPTPNPAPRPNPAPSAGGETLDDIVARTQAENDRRAGITALLKEYIQRAPDRLRDLEATGRLALEGNWTVRETEFQLLKQSYGNGPLAFSPSKPLAEQDVLEAAVCRAAGMQRGVVESSFGDKTLSAADRLFRGGCGLQRLIVTCAQSNGYRDADISGLRNTLRAAFRDGSDDPFAPAASAGFGPSTYSLSGILSNVANKFIVDAFNHVESVWRRITATRPVSDFKEISSFALTGDLTYKKVGPGGEVKHGTLGETEYGNQAELFALMLGIDYKHIRNDDLGAFAKLSTRLGRGGALTVNDEFWKAFVEFASGFWSVANQNYAAHADYAFTLDNLENVSAAWDLRTDPDGKPMGDQAKFLLVPTALDVRSRRHMRSTTVGDASDEGTENVMAGKWEPITSTYLGNATIPGSSVSDYYLVADPMALPVIETVFLDGQEMPTVEMAEPDLSRLGIMIRGVHAFGCRRQEKRGAFRFKQSA